MNLLQIINTLLGLFLPALVFTEIENEINGNRNKMKENYIYYLFFINIISYAVTIFIFNNIFFTFENRFTIKYLILSFAAGVLILFIKRSTLPASIIKIFRENILIELKVEKNEQTKEKKSKSPKE